MHGGAGGVTRSEESNLYVADKSVSTCRALLKGGGGDANVWRERDAAAYTFSIVGKLRY